MFLSRTITRSRWLRATILRGHGFIAQSPVLAPVPSFILSSDHGTHSLDQTLYLVSGAQQRVRLQFAHRELTLYFTVLPHPGPFSLSSFLLWPSHYQAKFTALSQEPCFQAHWAVCHRKPSREKQGLPKWVWKQIRSGQAFSKSTISKETLSQKHTARARLDSLLSDKKHRISQDRCRGMELSCHLWYQHPIWAPAPVLAASFLIHIPANAFGQNSGRWTKNSSPWHPLDRNPR